MTNPVIDSNSKSLFTFLKKDEQVHSSSKKDDQSQARRVDNCNKYSYGEKSDCKIDAISDRHGFSKMTGEELEQKVRDLSETNAAKDREISRERNEHYRQSDIKARVNLGLKIENDRLENENRLLKKMTKIDGGEELQEQFRVLSAKNMNLRSDNESLRFDADAYKYEISQLLKASHNDFKEKKRLREEINELRNENNKLKDEVSLLNTRIKMLKLLSYIFEGNSPEKNENIAQKILHDIIEENKKN